MIFQRAWQKTPQEKKTSMLIFFFFKKRKKNNHQIFEDLLSSAF